MKTPFIILSISLFVCVNVTAQTPTAGKNAVTEQIPRNAMTTISGDYTAVQTSISYSDGFSRNTQVIQYKGVPDATKDLVVSNSEFDILGRQSKVILPTPATGATGAFLTTTQANAVNFYGDNAPFSNVDTYEASPLNRPLKSYGAGQAWRNNTKFSEMQYEKVGTEIYLFTLNGTTISKGNYPANSLYKEIGISERGNRSITYKDKLGRVVQKSVQDGVDVNNNPTYINTSYIFDQFDRLLAVITPELYKWFSTRSSITTTQNEFKELAFFYEYDRRGRLASKQVPGAGISRYIYDKFDRVVLENDDKDANTTPANYYIFKKYDPLGRIIMTGLINNIGGYSRASLQADFDNYTGTPYETRTSTGGLLGYTNTSFPSSYTPADLNVKSVMYYDNYDWNTNPLFNFQSANAYHAQEDAKGMMTGTLFRNLETGVWYKSINYYDFKKRVIEQFSQNRVGGIDRMDYQYRFNGEVLKMKMVHQGITEIYDYFYNHVGQKIRFTYTKDGVTQNVASYDLDGIGRLQAKVFKPAGSTMNSKQTGNWTDVNTWLSGFLPSVADNVTINSGHTVTIPNGQSGSVGVLNDKGILNNYGTLSMGKFTTGDLQTVFYSYHIRGGLRGINLDASGNLTNKIFSLKLGYEEGIGGYFDNNISSQSWRSSLDNQTRGFTYSYDQASRIKFGLYTGVGNENYSLNSVTYDLNGNITALSRNGMKAVNSFGLVDNLAYTYQANSNKIQAVTDNSGETASFADATGTTDYNHWEDGSLKSDNNKGISLIEYNYLKRPKRIVKGSTIILYEYDASGRKLREIIGSDTTDYVGNLIYKNRILYQIAHDEGRIINGEYEYNIKDHLGNLRVAFRDSLGIAKISQSEAYGIWGESLPSLSYLKTSWKKDEFRFTGKENLAETGYTDFGARFYDNLVPRFISVDGLSEKGRRWSPYAYGGDNPIRNIDPDGMEWLEAKDQHIANALQKLIKSRISIEQKNVTSANEKINSLTNKIASEGTSAKLEKQLKNAQGDLADANSAISELNSASSELTEMGSQDVSQKFTFMDASGEVGDTYRDKASGVITMEIVNKDGNAIHEATHGYQIFKGKLISSAKGDVRSPAGIDGFVNAEIPAYRRQYALSRVGFPNSFTTSLSNIQGINKEWLYGVQDSNGNFIYSNIYFPRLTNEQIKSALKQMPKN